MKQRGVLLRGIAGVLNASGCVILNVYDAVTSIKTGILPGERGTLKARLREYEKKLERLYYEIGREVAVREYSTQMSAEGEAGIKLAADYRVEIENIKKRIKEIEIPDHELQKDSDESEAPVAGEKLPDAETEEKADTAVLETLLKSDLLNICSEKGIEANKRMTKADLIELISGR